MNDAIPKFVMFILDLQKIQNVKLTNQNNNKLTSEELKNIDSVLNYLINIEPRIDTLMLNFKKEEFIKSSAFLFYSNFLNFYFIRESKQKLLNNCVPFLYCKLNMREFDELEMLTNIDTYLLLVNFINHPNSKFNKEEILSKQNEDQLFKDAKIPKLFDQQFLNYCKLLKQIPDFLYYQLQFIFNVIDVNSEKLKIVLNLLNIAPKLNFINVPPIDTIAEKINQRIMSKNIMDKKFKLEFSNNNYAMKERQNYGSSSNEFKNKISGVFIALEFIDLFNYSYDNGILFNQELNNQRSKQLENQWINQINDIQQQIKLNNKQQKMLENNQSVLTEAKLHKLFVYDDMKEKWNFNNDVFLNFCNEKSINSNAIKTPLILFLNSFEDDLINITTKLINIQQPNLDENNQQQIFIYALCDINFLSEIKPIFLLLHVPKTRQNQPKIKNIIFQINSFLSYICDVQVVVLNKKYFMDQNEVIQIINNLYSQKGEIQHLPKQKPNISVESKKIDSELNNNDDDENVVVIIDDDDDEFEQQANSNSLEQEDHFVSNVNIVKSSSIQMSPKVLSRKCKSIFLINDATVHCYDDQFDLEINQNPFFQRIFQSFGKNNLSLHYINANNQNTYIPFLTSLKEYCSESQLQFNDILKSFQFIKMSELNNRYIQIKSQKTWRNELGKMIMNRFSMLRSNSSDSFHIATMIGEEIKLISILFDSDFNHECNTILSKIEIIDDKKRQNVFQTFLINSNNFLKNMMSFEQYEFLDKKNVSLSKKKVINFLKSEYFRAIKDVYGLNNLTIFYEKNIDILNNAIEECLIEIDKFVQSILIKYDQYRKREDLLYITCGSTNYEIRQREKVKEIKVQIASAGDLKDEIDQDF